MDGQGFLGRETNRWQTLWILVQNFYKMFLSGERKHFLWIFCCKEKKSQKNLKSLSWLKRTSQEGRESPAFSKEKTKSFEKKLERFFQTVFVLAYLADLSFSFTQKYLLATWKLKSDIKCNGVFYASEFGYIASIKPYGLNHMVYLDAAASHLQWCMFLCKNRKYCRWGA